MEERNLSTLPVVDMDNNLTQEQPLATAENDADEEAVLRKYVKELGKAGEFWMGQIDNEEALESLERELMTLGVSFKTQSSRNYSQEHATENSAGRFFFSMENGAVPIHLDVPFRMVSKAIKGCLFGRDRHKTEAKRAAALANGVDNAPQKKKTKPFGTKKKGCTATLHLKVVEAYPDFKVPVEGVSGYRIKMLKAAQLSKLAEALSSGQEVRCQRLTFLAMSRRSCHSGHGFDDLLNRRSRERRRSSAQPSLNKARASLLENVDRVTALCAQCTDVGKLKAAIGLVVEVQKLLAEGTPTATCHDQQSLPIDKGCSGERKRKPTGCARLCPLSPVKKQVVQVITSDRVKTILFQGLTS